jgi:hypothetical protein
VAKGQTRWTGFDEKCYTIGELENNWAGVVQWQYRSFVTVINRWTSISLSIGTGFFLGVRIFCQARRPMDPAP